MNDSLCQTHGYAPAPCPRPDPLPCELVPLALLVDVRPVYEVTCQLCRGPLEAGLHRTVEQAMTDRQAHVKSHLRGAYS